MVGVNESVGQLTEVPVDCEPIHTDRALLQNQPLIHKVLEVGVEARQLWFVSLPLGLCESCVTP